MRLLSLLPVILWLLAACQEAPLAAVPPTPTPVEIVRALATVYISPMPNAAEQQATRQAFVPPTATPPGTAVPPTMTPTVYIGVFQGESSELDAAGIAALAPSITPPPARPTRPVISCQMQPDERFGVAWRQAAQASQIGCPAEAGIPYSGAAQVFERGVMYITPDGEIWAVSIGGGQPGQWWSFDGAPESSGAPIEVTPGLRIPSGALGAAWSAVPDMRAAIGFARTDDTGNTFIVQLFQAGTLLHDGDAGQTFLLVGAGTQGAAFGPY